jgi:hypothetical protein
LTSLRRLESKAHAEFHAPEGPHSDRLPNGGRRERTIKRTLIWVFEGVLQMSTFGLSRPVGENLLFTIRRQIILPVRRNLIDGAECG